MATCIAAAEAQIQISEKGNTIKVGETPTDENIRNIDGYQKTISERMCKWAAPTYGDPGINFEQVAWQTAALAVAIATTVAQQDIADDRYDLSKQYVELAEDRWRQFTGSFAPFEQAMMNAAANEPLYQRDYAGARARGAEAVNAAYREANDQFADGVKRYSLCLDQSIYNNLGLEAAKMRDDSINFNYRDEEFFGYIRDDRRWNRRNKMLNFGRDILTTSANYADAANNALAGLGNALGSAAQGASQALGYMSSIRETMYPQAFTKINCDPTAANPNLQQPSTHS